MERTKTQECKSDRKPYITRNGIQQWKPSVDLLMSMGSESEGFCLGCGEVQDGVEPDARQYLCHCCGAGKVYGAEELALMGIFF